MCNEFVRNVYERLIMVFFINKFWGNKFIISCIMIYIIQNNLFNIIIFCIAFLTKRKERFVGKINEERECKQNCRWRVIFLRRKLGGLRYVDKMIY